MSELLKINVNEHAEKKNGLSYLSWAWAWAEVLKIDPQATWEAVEFSGFPAAFSPDGSAMVKVIVTLKGHAKSCWLPVMDHRNKAIKNPDAFAVNTALVRCLTKCISMHGLGLYIYAGEDLPEGEEPEPKPEPEPRSFRSTPTDGPIEVAEERQTMIELAASVAAQKFKTGMKDEAFDALVEFLTGDDDEIFLWQNLKAHSALRAYIKFRKEQAAKRTQTTTEEEVF